MFPFYSILRNLNILLPSAWILKMHTTTIYVCRTSEHITTYAFNKPFNIDTYVPEYSEDVIKVR